MQRISIESKNMHRNLETKEEGDIDGVIEEREVTTGRREQRGMYCSVETEEEGY